MHVNPFMFGCGICLAAFAVAQLQRVPARFTIPPRPINLTQVLMVVYRHGERNPLGEYPTSEFFDEANWKEGFAQLTLSGMKMQFEFGKWIMAHYGPTGLNFLPPEYDRAYYKVFSTNNERAFQSALANSAGIYHQTTSDELDSNSQRNPIPVWRVKDDKYDTVFGQFCPVAQKTLEKLKRERMDNLSLQYPELFQYVEQNSGIDMSTEKIMIVLIYDTLKIEKSLKGKIPEWAEPIFSHPLRMYYEEYSNKNTDTQKLTRLLAGPTLKTIIGLMVNNSKGEDAVKLYSFSGHDFNVHAIMKALGLPLTTPAEYTSAVIFELYRDKRKNYYVKVLYRPGPGTEVPEGQVIPGCGGTQYCTLETFIEVARDSLPLDLEKECALTTDEFIQLSMEKPSFSRTHGYPCNIYIIICIDIGVTLFWNRNIIYLQ